MVLVPSAQWFGTCTQVSQDRLPSPGCCWRLGCNGPLVFSLFPALCQGATGLTGLAMVAPWPLAAGVISSPSTQQPPASLTAAHLRASPDSGHLRKASSRERGGGRGSCRGSEGPGCLGERGGSCLPGRCVGDLRAAEGSGVWGPGQAAGTPRLAEHPGGGGPQARARPGVREAGPARALGGAGLQAPGSPAVLPERAGGEPRLQHGAGRGAGGARLRPA